MRLQNESGSIVAESALVIALVTLLCGSIVQLGVILYTRNIMIDAALAGARYAALADRNLSDGVDRTSTILTSSIPNTDTAAISISSEPQEHIISVTVQHQLPILGFFTAPVPLSVTAQAYDLSQ